MKKAVFPQKYSFFISLKRLGRCFILHYFATFARNIAIRLPTEALGAYEVWSVSY